MRSGQFAKQPGAIGRSSPRRYLQPPHPPVWMDGELSKLLSDADRCLGRLFESPSAVDE